MLRDHGVEDKQIAAGESGIVVCPVSSDDRRLARQLYIDIKVDRESERAKQIWVIPTEVKPAEARIISSSL